MKYKITETVGCTAFGFNINDKPMSNYSQEQLDEVLDYLFVQIKSQIKSGNMLLQDVVRLFQCDSYDYTKEPCDQCGDTIETTTWKI